MSKEPVTVRLVAAIAAAAMCVVVPLESRGQTLQAVVPPTPVEAQPVGHATMVDTVRAIGTLRANQSIVVRSEIPGLVTRIEFTDTREVDKGQALFQLDDSMDRAQVAQAEAALKLAESNYARAQELLNRGAGTIQARDQALSTREADRAAVALARARLDKSAIRAPFSGVVGMSRIDRGAYVTAGQDLVTLDDIAALRLDFTVPERYARFVALGQKVLVEADSLPGRAFTGEVAVIDTRIDPLTRALGVRAMIDNRDRALRPGQFVRAVVQVNSRADALVIPEQAIVPLGDRLLVFRVIANKAVETPVKIGLREFGRAEIVEGLAPEDIVIVAGQQKVQDGGPVVILPAFGAAQPPAPAIVENRGSGPMPANAAEPAHR